MYQEYAIQIQSKLDKQTASCLESIQLQIRAIDTFNKPSIKTISGRKRLKSLNVNKSRRRSH
ncbi:hypothetical protein D3C85_1907830 [compost metagenome]